MILPRVIAATDLAYLAGIIDGEGHIGLIRRKRSWKRDPQRMHYLRPIVQIGQAKRGLLDHIEKVVGSGSLAIHGQRVFYNLRFYTGTLKWLLPQLLPYLVVKRRQAEIVLAFIARATTHCGIDLSAEELFARELLAQEIRTLNKKPAALAREAQVS